MTGARGGDCRPFKLSETRGEPPCEYDPCYAAAFVGSARAHTIRIPFHPRDPEAPNVRGFSAFCLITK